MIQHELSLELRLLYFLPVCIEGRVTLSEGVALSVTTKIGTFFMRNLGGSLVFRSYTVLGRKFKIGME